MQQAGAVRLVEDSEALGLAVIELLKSKILADELAHNAGQVVESARGASDTILAHVDALKAGA